MKDSVDCRLYCCCSVQLLRKVKASVHQWTKNLADDSNVSVEVKDRLSLNMAHSSYWNLTRLMNTSSVKMPLKQGMPIADAERDFHAYVRFICCTRASKGTPGDANASQKSLGDKNKDVGGQV